MTNVTYSYSIGERSARAVQESIYWIENDEIKDTYITASIITNDKTSIWTIQRNGCDIDKNISLEQAMKLMDQGEYNLIKNKMCHSAQTNLRETLCNPTLPTQSGFQQWNGDLFYN